MRISDWSSDVCASDLIIGNARHLELDQLDVGLPVAGLALHHPGRRSRRILTLATAAQCQRRAERGDRQKLLHASMSFSIAVLGPSRKVAIASLSERSQIGRSHVCTPVTNAHLVCPLLLGKQKK